MLSYFKGADRQTDVQERLQNFVSHFNELHRLLFATSVLILRKHCRFGHTFQSED
jgi:hypothetical protein